jgi:Dipeptidyl aminopeptidases/acylaminoacyl-peptidases
MNKVFEECLVPITGGVSLEGQSIGPPDFSDPRQAYALTRLANGTLLDAIFPSKDWNKVDPARNISPYFPPTFIAHGTADSKVPIGVSRELFRILKDHGVHCGMSEIPEEDHTFAAKMQVGSRTWELQRLGFDFLESLV